MNNIIKLFVLAGIIALTATSCHKNEIDSHIPDGALPGVFSVSEAKKVHFSKGNMFYDGSAYKFESNQYDFRQYNGKTGDTSSINGISGDTPAGTVGSFWWIKNTETAVNPFDGTYGTPAPANSATDIFFTNSTKDTPNPKFTCNGATGVWRTLSKDEWGYLLNIDGTSGRKDANRFAWANVKGVAGLIIFPDGYSGTTSGTGITALNTKNSFFPTSSMPEATWTSMESAGCVFLPAAGVRGNTTAPFIGSWAPYWTSEADSDANAYDLFFGNSYDATPSDVSSRAAGVPVRLVTAAN